MYQSLIEDEDEIQVEDTIDCNCFDNMLDAKYEKVNPVDVANAQTHLSSSQKEDLAKLLSK